MQSVSCLAFDFCRCWVRPKLLTISSISVLALVVFCCWPFTGIFWESESFSCSWMWMVTWWFSCRRLMFVPPFPIMVLAVFLGMRHFSAVVSGWGRGMFAVTFVVGCWASWLLLLVLLFTRLLIILAVISPLSALRGFRLPWWFRGRLPPSVSLRSLLSFFLWLGCSYIDWSFCCCPCFLVVGGRGLRWLFVASLFLVVLWGRSFFCHSVPVLSVPDVVCALHNDDMVVFLRWVVCPLL